jgi:hypothetical protein
MPALAALADAGALGGLAAPARPTASSVAVCPGPQPFVPFRPDDLCHLSHYSAERRAIMKNFSLTPDKC